MNRRISSVVIGVVSLLMFSTLVFAQTGFDDVIEQLKGIGVFQFYLPFILVFAILYGMLMRSKIFGEKGGIPIVIALAAAAYITVYTPVGISFSQFLANFVGNTMVVILTLLAVLMMAAMLKTGGIDFAGMFAGNTLWVALIFLLLIVFGVFIASGGASIFPGLNLLPTETFRTIGGADTTTVALILLVFGTGLIILLVTRGNGGGAGAGGPPRP